MGFNRMKGAKEMTEFTKSDDKTTPGQLKAANKAVADWGGVDPDFKGSDETFEAVDNPERFYQLRQVYETIVESFRSIPDYTVHEFRDPFTPDSLLLGKGSNTPNPYYRRTEDGFYWQGYYGGPGYLWTPWGEYRIFQGHNGRQSKAYDRAVESMLESLGAKLEIEEKENVFGYIDPIYSLHQLSNGAALPEPKIASGSAFDYSIPALRLSSEEYERFKAAWSELVNQTANQS
jgi:hypothetical protein